MYGVDLSSFPEEWKNRIAEMARDRSDLKPQEILNTVLDDMRKQGLLDDNNNYIGEQKSAKSTEKKSTRAKKPKSTKEKKAVTKEPKIRTVRNSKRHDLGRLATMVIEDNPENIEVVDRDITFTELTHKIESIMDAYNNKVGYDWEHWRTKGKPQEWRGMCSAVGKFFRANRGILKQGIKDYGSATVTNNNAYDYNGKLTELLFYYADICYYVGLPVKALDFIIFLGIDTANLYNWGVPTSAGYEFYKKVMIYQAESIASCAEGNRIAQVVGLARLNAFHGWTKTTEVVHSTSGNVTPTASLPRFDAPMIESNDN